MIGEYDFSRVEEESREVTSLSKRAIPYTIPFIKPNSFQGLIKIITSFHQRLSLCEKALEG